MKKGISLSRSKVLKTFYWPLLLIRSVFFPLSKIPFVIIIILAGYYALSINDQGQDLMAAFTAKTFFDTKNVYAILFVIFLICWAVSIWNVSRILLTAANIRKLVEDEIKEEELEKEHIDEAVRKRKWIVASVDPNYKRIMTFTNEWTPRILALFPYFIFIDAYLKQDKAFNSDHTENVIAVWIIAVLHLLYMIYRKWLGWKLFGKEKEYKQSESKSSYAIEEEKSVKAAIVKAKVVTNTILTVIITLIMFSYALWAANETPGHDGMPGLIVLTGFTVYTLLGLVLNLLINRLRVPVFTLLVIFAVLVAFNKNNNHTIQTLTADADFSMLAKRNNLTDSGYADYWLRKKLEAGVFDTSKTEYVFIIAAEGGGIRNCYWTYRVLNELQILNSNFHTKTFAASGVSGGSIGLGFYYNFKYYCDSLIKAGGDTTGFANQLDIICSADYLSKVTYGFMFPDLLQRFIPATINSWDRSKFLANSFDKGFSDRLGADKNFLSNNYLSMWHDTLAYKYPALLFNTIFNEDGIKAIYSPFRLSDTYYPGAMDLLFEMDRPVPMKEAMVSSARFPVLTAPGLIWRDTLNTETKKRDPVKLGHISDGGGYENTGIQTAMETAMLLQSSINDRKLSKKIKIRIIYIGTGINPIDVLNKIPSGPKKHKKPIGKSYEIAWLQGGINTIFGWINSSYNMTHRLNPDLKVLQIGLEVKGEEDLHSLPLGWFLSDTSRKTLVRQSTYKTANAHFIEGIELFKKMK